MPVTATIGTAGFVAVVGAACHRPIALLQSTRSSSASPSPRQVPTLVTMICDKSARAFAAYRRFPPAQTACHARCTAQPMPRLAGNWASIP